MKSSKTYFLITGVIILSICTGIFIWQNKIFKKIPKYSEQAFIDPATSKYIPENADFVFHWKLNPNMIPSYFENHQDRISNNVINKKVSLIRDTFFKLTSIDFTRDISKWVGDYGSFAVFDSDKESLDDWIMVLAIKDDIKAEEEFESFLESINIHKNENNSKILDNSNTAIISKNINTNNEIYFANEQDKLLVASNPKIIKSSFEKIEGNLLGPVNAPLFRLKKKFRIRFLIRGPKSMILQSSIAKIIPKYKFSPGIKLSVDVDPINFN